MPRRDYDEEDDDFDRPRRPRRKKRKPQPIPPILWQLFGLMAGGVFCVALCIGIGYLVWTERLPSLRPGATPAAAHPGPLPITLTAARRLNRPNALPRLEIDYTANGPRLAGSLVLVLDGYTGVSEAGVSGLVNDTPGTLALDKHTFERGFNGRLRLWIEHRTGGTASRVSNILVLE